MNIKVIVNIVLLLAFFFLSSCQEEKPFVLSENDLKMVPILMDVYTVESALREIKDLVTKDSLKKAYFNQLYQIHQIDENWLNEQRQRLEADPIRMDSVYSRTLILIEKYKSAGKPPI